MQEGKENRKVGISSAVGLNICVLCAEELLCALARDIFHYINILTAAVTTLRGIALCVFIGKHSARGEKHRFACKVCGYAIKRDVDGSKTCKTTFLLSDVLDTSHAYFKVKYSFKNIPVGDEFNSQVYTKLDRGRFWFNFKAEVEAA